MRKELLGTNPDGTPHYNWIAEDGERAVVTGPIVADLTMSDGTVYDVTDPVVGVFDRHHDELINAIGDHYAEHGHPHHAAGKPFIHEKG